MKIERNFPDEAIYGWGGSASWFAKIGGVVGTVWFSYNEEFKTAAISASIATGAYFLGKWINNRDKNKYGKHIESYVKENPNWWKD